jgi:hypothetical protein
MATGTGLPLPKFDANASPISTIDGDRLSSARSWATIAAAGDKISDAAERDIYRHRVAEMAEQENAIERQRIEMREKFQYDPEGFDKNWKALGDGIISKTAPHLVDKVKATLGHKGNATYSTILQQTNNKNDQLAADSINTKLEASKNEVLGHADAGTLHLPAGKAAEAELRAAAAASVNARLMSQERADLTIAEVGSRAYGALHGRQAVDVFRATGGDEKAAVEYLRKNILENTDLQLDPAAKRRAFNAGRAMIREESIGIQKARVDVTQRGREMERALDAGLPVADADLQDMKDEALAVGAAGLHRRLSVKSGVQQATAGRSLPEQAAVVAGRRGMVGAPEQQGAISSAAQRLGIAPRDLAAAISYETGGTFDPNKWGGKGGNHLGLIQFGREERATYGVRPGMTFEQQMGAVENYLRDRGVKPGMGISDIYRTINGGNPNASLNASDGNGTIAQHIERIKAGHYVSADRFFGGAVPTYDMETTKGIQDNLVKDAKRAWPAMQRQMQAGTLPDADDLDAVIQAAALSGDQNWIGQVKEVALANSVYQTTQGRAQLERMFVADQAKQHLSETVHKALVGMYERDNKMLATNQYGYALDKKLTPAIPLDPNSQNGFGQGLAARAHTVQAIARDQRVAPTGVLQPDEIAPIKHALETASNENKLRMFGDMAAVLPESVYQATMEQLGNDTLTQFVGKMVRDRGDLAREILRGEELMKIDKTDKGKPSPVRQAFGNVLGGSLYPSAADQNNVTQAAMALYTARRGGLYDPTDTAGIEKAIEDVTGKIVKQGGQKVAIPIGMTAAQFDNVMSRLTPESLGQFGGAFDRTGRAFDPQFLANRAVLKQLGPGDSNYLVALPDATARDGIAPVITAEGSPLVIDLKELAASTRLAPPTAYQRGVGAFRAGQAERIQEERRAAGVP